MDSSNYIDIHIDTKLNWKRHQLIHQSRLEKIKNSPPIVPSPSTSLLDLQKTKDRTKAHYQKEYIEKIKQQNNALLNRLVKITTASKNKRSFTPTLKSLNINKRIRESQRITEENMRLADRISHRKSTLSFGSWEDSYRQAKKYKRSISKILLQ
ncbi:unnamed protein product [Blepharisma stoltei]|uniref:Uncharacterized protein n=1 Tax=Blepharisma stoltei TaxID=1481888 RepID=A0AAU9IEV8_9CILI|nr:unnamed protein product [Blepharisma stoltei]